MTTAWLLAWLDLRRPLRWKRIGQGQTFGHGPPLRAEVMGRIPDGPWPLLCLLDKRSAGVYRAGRLPGRRRIRKAARRRAPRKMAMPMNSKYRRPFATTPTIPSTIATITSSRNKAIIGSSAPFACSAAGQPSLAVCARSRGILRRQPHRDRAIRGFGSLEHASGPPIAPHLHILLPGHEAT